MSKEIIGKVDGLLAEYGVKFSVKYVGETVKKDWGGDTVDHFRFRLGDYEGDYYMGLGNRGPTRKPISPRAADVLYCILSDAEAEDCSFSDWCDMFCYDYDSIKALEIYRECEKTARELRRIFTRDQIAALRDALQDF